MLRGATILATLSWFLMSCAHQAGSQDARLDDEWARTIAALTSTADSDSLTAAGLLAYLKHRQDSLSLLKRAAEQAPERADLTWVAIQACQRQPPCDPEPLEQHLHALDPTNGAAWLWALARAAQQHDDAGEQAALAAIARSARVDIYWTALVAKLTPPVARTGTMSWREATLAVTGVLAGEAIPAYKNLSDWCMGERLQKQEIVDQCRDIARALLHGDTFITEMTGVTIAQRVWPEGSSEWRAASAARRVYEYQIRSQADLDLTLVSEKAVRGYLALCAQNHSEQEVAAARLRAAGRSSTPLVE